MSKTRNETHSRLEEMADKLMITLDHLISVSDECGLEIISKRARKTKKPLQHC